MKSNELLRLLKRHGCYLVRQGKGSHQVWFSPITNAEFVVPDHGASEVGTGLANKILKAAGVK
ncbi:hypothetical protein GCM10027516_32520 [Niabella aquatica]